MRTLLRFSVTWTARCARCVQDVSLSSSFLRSLMSNARWATRQQAQPQPTARSRSGTPTTPPTGTRRSSLRSEDERAARRSPCSSRLAPLPWTVRRKAARAGSACTCSTARTRRARSSCGRSRGSAPRARGSSSANSCRLRARPPAHPPTRSPQRSAHAIRTTTGLRRARGRGRSALLPASVRRVRRAGLRWWSPRGVGRVLERRGDGELRGPHA